MKSKKTEKNNGGQRRLIYAALAIIIILVALIVSLQSYFGGGRGIPKAAIIDQLGSSRLDEAIRDENETFVNATRELLYKRFSVVDYYSDNATVEEYKQLASEGYRLIVWRAHSALDLSSTYIAISATDKFPLNNDQYVPYLNNGQLTVCNITGYYYLGITPKFIDEVMTGTFQDTVIILMSCNGLKQDYLKTAQAFEAKGAKAVISWDDWVSPSDNDNGTSLLLQYLIDENNTVSAAVGKIAPFLSVFGWASLQYDPHSPQASNYQIPDYRQNSGVQQGGLMTLTFAARFEDHSRQDDGKDSIC